MKYWIMLNGVQLGPLDDAQTRALPLTPDTPVWCEGFADWTPASRVESLSDLFGGRPYARGYQQGWQQGDRQGYNDGVSQGWQQGVNQGYNQGMNQGYQQGYSQGWQQDGGGGGDVLPPEPPTYLALSILCTLLCCLPFGIVAIIMSAGVSSAYNRGDYQTAKRKSDAARNWIIASAVCGVIGMALYLVVYAPFAMLAGLG